MLECTVKITSVQVSMFFLGLLEDDTKVQRIDQLNCGHLSSQWKIYSKITCENCVCMHMHTTLVALDYYLFCFQEYYEGMPIFYDCLLVYQLLCLNQSHEALSLTG